MMARFTDEQLQAFLDGQLDAEMESAIEDAINADPALVQRLENLPEADWHADLVRQAFAPVLQAGVPERLIAATISGTGNSVIDFDHAKRRLAVAKSGAKPSFTTTGTAWHWPQFTAMAASLAIGALFGYTISDKASMASDDTLVFASVQGAVIPSALNEVLATTPSGRSVQLAGLGTAEVVLSFRSVDQDICRQFTLKSNAGVSDALACRANGQWQLVAFGRRTDQIGEMRTAGGDASPAVTAAVDQMIADDILIGEAERTELGIR